MKRWSVYQACRLDLALVAGARGYVLKDDVYEVIDGIRLC
jgi:hypothetical protein